MKAELKNLFNNGEALLKQASKLIGNASLQSDCYEWQISYEQWRSKYDNSKLVCKIKQRIVELKSNTLLNQDERGLLIRENEEFLKFINKGY